MKGWAYLLIDSLARGSHRRNFHAYCKPFIPFEYICQSTWVSVTAFSGSVGAEYGLATVVADYLFGGACLLRIGILRAWELVYGGLMGWTRAISWVSAIRLRHVFGDLLLAVAAGLLVVCLLSHHSWPTVRFLWRNSFLLEFKSRLSHSWLDITDVR